MSTMELEVLNELRSKGFCIDQIHLDGEIYRFDRDGRQNGWYWGRAGITKSGIHFCIVFYGDWKDGSKHKYRYPNTVSKKEEFEIRRFESIKSTEFQIKKEELSQKAIQEAKYLWSVARAEGTNKYLSRKKIPLFGAKILKDKVIILPIRNVSGDLKGIQKIYDNGDKIFISGQSNKGNFVLIPDNFPLKEYKGIIYAVEGFATGASIHVATNKPVICALNAGNLKSVLLGIKKFNPRAGIIIAGDDDKHTAGNPGLTKATEAAEAVGAAVVFPQFPESKNRFTDFSDLYLNYGSLEVKRQLEQAKPFEKNSVPSIILARQFLDENKMHSINKLVLWRQEFYQFNKKCFYKISESDLLNDITQFLQNHPIMWIKSSKKLAREVLGNIEAMVNLRSEKSMPFWIGCENETVSNLISVENGLIDLASVNEASEIKLLPHTYDLFSTVVLPVKFDSHARCNNWLKFLDQMVPDKDTQKALGEWAGYNLIYDNKFQKLAILLGQGANGKSVYCVVLTSLLGADNVSAVALEAFDPKRTFNMASTVGKLANIVEELNFNSRAEEGVIKQFVSGGMMTVERKNKDPFHVIPTARLTFATNILPRISDTSEGMWRRVLLFPFNKQILDQKEQRKELVDPNFWINSGELSGILNWALDGLLRLKKNEAFTVSSEMQTALAKFKADSNPTKEFLRQHCQVKQGSILSSSELYNQYRIYMEENGYHGKFGENKFSDEVKAIFPEALKSDNAIRIDGQRRRAWHNLELIPYVRTANTP